MHRCPATRIACTGLGKAAGRVAQCVQTKPAPHHIGRVWPAASEWFHEDFHIAIDRMDAIRRTHGDRARTGAGIRRAFE